MSRQCPALTRLPAYETCGGYSGSLFSFEKFEFVLPKCPTDFGADRRSRGLVDLSIGAGADAICAICGTTIVVDPSRRNSPAKTKVAHCKQQ
jgi:hypothetical protein